MKMKNQQRKRDTALWVAPWSSKEEAKYYATKSADEFSIPQTVFRCHDDGGTNWRHTASLAPIFDRNPNIIFHVTILPFNYFH
jgi:hypothetical protein